MYQQQVKLHLAATRRAVEMIINQCLHTLLLGGRYNDPAIYYEPHVRDRAALSVMLQVTIKTAAQITDDTQWRVMIPTDTFNRLADTACEVLYALRDHPTINRLIHHYIPHPTTYFKASLLSSRHLHITTQEFTQEF